MTKALILFLIVLMPLWGYEGKDLRERISKMKHTNDQMLAKDKSATPEAVELDVLPAPSPVVIPPAPQGDRLTRLEVTVEYMQKYIDALTKQVADMNGNMIGIVATMEAQTKVAESGKTKSDRADLIINIILGLVSIFVGGGGYVVLKNKHLVFKPKLKDDLSQTKG